jgi:hypothetical protein
LDFKEDKGLVSIQIFYFDDQTLKDLDIVEKPFEREELSDALTSPCNEQHGC